MHDESTRYIATPIDEFITGVTTPVNVYIRLGSDKYVLVFKAGSKTQKEQLKNYRDRDIDYLWIREDEYPRMAKQSIAIAGVVMSQNKFTVQQKSRFLTAAIQPVFADLEHTGFKQAHFENAQKMTSVTMSLVEHHSDLFALFEGLKACNDRHILQATAVCAVSLMIANELGWENKLTLEKLALGALLHDIGLKTLPKDLIDKPVFEMTNEESSTYETHPYRGMMMLTSLGVIPDDVVSIVYEHHENAIGLGYPRKMRDMKMHPLARIVAMAETFVQLVFPSKDNPQSKSVRAALMYMEYTMGQPFNRECFRALKRLVGDETMAA